MSFEINGIKKSFKKRRILNDVSFSAEKGMCVGILGANGSGKSTLLSILAGVQRADSGSFVYDGDDLIKNAKKRADLVGYVPQGTPLLEELTAKDNLLLWYTGERLRSELKGGVLSLLGISEFINVPVCKMSGGMKKRLSIGCSVSGHPEILLLDEPSAALDLVCKEHIYEYLRAFMKNGGTVVIATHDIQELPLCDATYILKDGRLAPYEYDGDIHRLVGSL